MIGHDRKWQAEQKSNQPRLELFQSRADRVAALGCAVILIAVIVVIWPGLVMH